MTKKQELTVLTPEELAYINSLKPQGQSTGYGPGIDKVDFIIKLKKDEDGNKIMPPKFKVGKRLADKIQFRPVRTFNQVIKSIQDDEGNFKVISQTIYFTDYGQELLDTAGGLACGRLFGKAAKALSEEEAKKNKDSATVYMFVFGFAKVDGEEVPAYMRLARGKMYNFGKALNSVPKDAVMAHYYFDMELVETETPSGDIGYNLEVEPDLRNKLPISDVLQFDREMLEWVSGENQKVIQKHLSVNKGLNVPVAEPEMVDVTPDDLDDQIPF